MPNLEAVARRIVELVEHHQPSLGSAIGTILKVEWPDLELRRDHGGLRQFIERYCPEVVWVAKRGGDDEFSMKGLDAPEHSREDNSQVSAWRAFTTPDLGFVVAIAEVDGKLVVRRPNGEQAGPVVEPMTVDDHRGIARSFLPEIPDVARAEFSRIADLPDFWQRWFHAMNSNRSLSSRWLPFRFEAICSMWRSRVLSTGVNAATAEAAQAELLKSKGTSQRTPPAAGRQLAQRTGQSRAPDDDAGELRALALRVVGAMNDEDIARLWIPLGAVFAATRRER